MDTFALLDEEERYKLFILRYLDLMRDEYITIAKLEETMGQSRFKINKYIQGLIEDLYLFETNPRIFVQEDEIILQNVDLEIIKLLQIEYFKNSYTFKLLVYLLEGKTSIEKFAEQNFLSTSKAYARRRELVAFLKPQGIKIKKNRIIGEELAVRDTLCSILFESLNGYYFPFSNSVNDLVREIINLLTYQFNLKLTPTQSKKLELLITVSLCRITTDCGLDHSFFTPSVQSVEEIKPLLNFIAHRYPNSDQTVQQNEISYLFLYLCNEDYLKDDWTINLDLSYFAELDHKSEQISQAIIAQLEIFYDFTIPPELLATYTRKIKQANRHHELFSFNTTSFLSRNPIQSINEIYPVYAEAVLAVLGNYIDELSTYQDDLKVRLFYDYFFILIALLPPERLEKPVYVCVDFSQGTEYTDFIIKQIQGFRDLNLVIERRISNQTDIYISDCVIDKFSGLQIVWKNPPQSTDWEYFGNAVVQVKKKILDLKRAENRQ